MITTLAGTEVLLITPIDPITGWVTVLANLGMNGVIEKEVDCLDLIATGGYDELEAASAALMHPVAFVEDDGTPEHVKGNDAYDHLMMMDFVADQDWHFEDKECK